MRTASETARLTTIHNGPFFGRVRRNHGLEHATLNLLALRYPRENIAGHSDGTGFWIIGNVTLEAVYTAVEEALERMRKGETHLAIHRNCGTNFVTAGVLAGTAAAVSMAGVGRSAREKLERLPLAILMATLALIVAQPLGFFLQEKVTTSGQPGDLQVIEILASRRGQLNAFRVITRG